MDQAGKYVADAVLGIDTLWGGDVMCPSGTGASLPIPGFPMSRCLLPTRIRRRRVCGNPAASRQEVDREAVEEYLRAVNLPQAIAGIREEAKDRRAAPALSGRDGGLP
jgi:hypothetical protein